MFIQSQCRVISFDSEDERVGFSDRKSRTDFTQILLESVNESISIVLGRPVGPELSHELQAYIGLSDDEMEDNVDRLFASLKDSFGLQGGDICGWQLR